MIHEHQHEWFLCFKKDLVKVYDCGCGQRKAIYPNEVEILDSVSAPRMKVLASFGQESATWSDFTQQVERN